MNAADHVWIDATSGVLTADSPPREASCDVCDSHGVAGISLAFSEAVDPVTMADGTERLALTCQSCHDHASEATSDAIARLLASLGIVLLDDNELDGLSA